jgi:hypothetical protein
MSEPVYSIPRHDLDAYLGMKAEKGLFRQRNYSALLDNCSSLVGQLIGSIHPSLMIPTATAQPTNMSALLQQLHHDAKQGS